MESITALGLASNILQIIDFSSRLISQSRELYKATDGRTKEHAVLFEAITRLAELYDKLLDPGDHDANNMQDSDEKLIGLKEDCQIAVSDLKAALNKAKMKNKNRRWESIHLALRSVKTEKEISLLAARLDEIRKQVDTAVLISIHASVKANPEFNVINPDKDLERRHDELMCAIRRHNWQPSDPHDVDAFSMYRTSLTIAELEARFRAMILSHLYFRQMPDRSDDIFEAHSRTFEWLFEERRDSCAAAMDATFTTWLQEQGCSIYWISGKPGSGKSTLMKFLYHHTSLPILLEKWAPKDSIVTAGFFFWNSGNAIQMSRLGLLRTLLHGSFSRDNALLISTMPERWEEFCVYGRMQEPFDEPELRRVFNRMILDESRRFFFLIDGLDEFEGDPTDIIQFVLGVARPNVKLCVASRPWLQFEDAFKQQPSLLLQDLTRRDISTYVWENFNKNDHFVCLQRSDPLAASALVHGIVDKSDGVFLWVYLVVASLIEGLLNSDPLEVLQTRLDALPGDLEALFERLLSRLDPEYFKLTCATFRLLRTYYTIIDSQSRKQSENTDPTLLNLYIAEGQDIRSSLQASVQDIGPVEANKFSDTMRRRLIARSKGFIEIHGKELTTGYGDMRICYLHRTAKDFVESESYWPKVLVATGQSLLKPEERWANAWMWALKRLPFDKKSNTTELCFHTAALIYAKTGIVQKKYLDELYHVRFEFIHGKIGSRKELLAYKGAMTCSQSHQGDYMALVLAEADPECRRHTMDTTLHGFLQAGFKESKILAKTLSYYQIPRKLRFLRRQPVLPQYE